MSCPDCRAYVAGLTLLAVFVALWIRQPVHAQRSSTVRSTEFVEARPEAVAISGISGLAVDIPVRHPEVTVESQPRGVRTYLPPNSRVGIGGLAGRTSGLTVRVVLTDESRRSGPFEERAVDVNASFNLNGHLHMTAHVTAERPVENSPLTFFIGPGWLAGAENGEAFFGASGNIGVYFMMDRYQIILQLMPGIRLTPDVDGETGAAVGLRLQL